MFWVIGLVIIFNNNCKVIEFEYFKYDYILEISIGEYRGERGIEEVVEEGEIREVASTPFWWLWIIFGETVALQNIILIVSRYLW